MRKATVVKGSPESCTSGCDGALELDPDYRVERGNAFLGSAEIAAKARLLESAARLVFDAPVCESEEKPGFSLMRPTSCDLRALQTP
jgi:hypothetical protein